MRRANSVTKVNNVLGDSIVGNTDSCGFPLHYAVQNITNRTCKTSDVKIASSTVTPAFASNSPTRNRTAANHNYQNSHNHSSSISEEELVCVKMQSLKKLLSDGRLTHAQFQDLRVQRRRLLNRGYAKRCANKKQREVSGLGEQIFKLQQEIARLRLKKTGLANVNEGLNSKMEFARRVMIGDWEGEERVARRDENDVIDSDDDNHLDKEKDDEENELSEDDDDFDYTELESGVEGAAEHNKKKRGEARRRDIFIQVHTNALEHPPSSCRNSATAAIGNGVGGGGGAAAVASSRTVMMMTGRRNDTHSSSNSPPGIQMMKLRVPCSN